MSASSEPRWRVEEPSAAWLSGGDLPDINVWVALVVESHVHHAAARRYWAQTSTLRRHFCRFTMLGLTRLLSQPKLMGEDVLSPVEAHAVYRRLRASANVEFVVDRETADLKLEAWLPDLPPRLSSDAWLAALAEAVGLRLVSFDKDFQRFPLTRHLLLDASQK